MPVDTERLNEFLGKAVGDMGAAMSAGLVMIGDRLGLYRALASDGPLNSTELSSRTDTKERYVREWLLNQAASGYVTYDPATEKYSMTPEQAFCLADPQSPGYIAGAFDIVASTLRDQPKVERVFTAGGGVPWGDHDACLFCGTERFFAANYRGNLLESWLPALDGVVERLRSGACAADVGCGHGASTILMAQAYVKSTFVGFDFHAPSIDCANQRARAAGLKNVRFQVADAVSFPGPNGGGSSELFDFIACFDCVHDMGDPAGCAKQVRRRLKPGGTWMVVEPDAGDKVEDNLNPVGRVFSAASTMICVPASLASGGPGLGACAGPTRLKSVLAQGGFASVRVATTTPFNLVLEARA